MIPIAAAAVSYGMQIAAAAVLKRQAIDGLRRGAAGLRPGLLVRSGDMADVQRQIQIARWTGDAHALVEALHETARAIGDRSQEIVPVEARRIEVTADG